MKINRRCRALMSLTVLLSMASLVTAEPKRFYRYVNTEGHQVIDSQIPPQKAIGGYEIIDEKGHVLKTVAHQPKGAELEAIKQKELDKKQKDVLLYIIREYVFNMEYEKATAEYDKILK